MAALLDSFKKDLVGNVFAGITAVVLAFALVFYAPAVLRNFSELVIVFGVIAILLYVAGMFVNLKGADVILGAALTAFCFGYYLIGRLESINLLQVNLSDINIYFYIDMALFSVALVCSILTGIVKKVR